MNCTLPRQKSVSLDKTDMKMKSGSKNKILSISETYHDPIPPFRQGTEKGKPKKYFMMFSSTVSRRGRSEVKLPAKVTYRVPGTMMGIGWAFTSWKWMRRSGSLPVSEGSKTSQRSQSTQCMQLLILITRRMLMERKIKKVTRI